MQGNRNIYIRYREIEKYKYIEDKALNGKKQNEQETKKERKGERKGEIKEEKEKRDIHR